MSRRRWILLMVIAALAVGIVLVSRGQPRRMLAGILGGVDALHYLPPRHEVELTPGPPQPTLTLAEAGIDPASLELAETYAQARHSTALVVGLNGHIVYQKFWGESGEVTLDSPLDASGFTPVLSALVLGTALQNGELRSLDVPLADYFKDWSQDPRGTITFRDLLLGNSNLAAPEGRTWPGTLAAQYYLSADLVATLTHWPQAAQPDPTGSPGDVDADLLAVALSRALQSNYPELLAERLWRPMGAGNFSLAVDAESRSPPVARAGCCLRARLSDWMRIGALIANQGIFEGNQFSPPDFARLLITPTHSGSPRAVFLRVDGQYATRDLVRLESAGKQRLWIVPSLKLVILRAGHEPPASQGWDDAMIPDSIIRGTRGWQPASSGEGGRVDPNLYAPHH